MVSPFFFLVIQEKVKQGDWNNEFTVIFISCCFLVSPGSKKRKSRGGGGAYSGPVPVRSQLGTSTHQSTVRNPKLPPTPLLPLLFHCKCIECEDIKRMLQVTWQIGGRNMCVSVFGWLSSPPPPPGERVAGTGGSLPGWWGGWAEPTPWYVIHLLPCHTQPTVTISGKYIQCGPIILSWFEPKLGTSQNSLRYLSSIYFYQAWNSCPVLKQNQFHAGIFFSQGGEVEFPRQKCRVRPGAGDVLVFPGRLTHPKTLHNVTDGVLHQLIIHLDSFKLRHFY